MPIIVNETHILVTGGNGYIGMPLVEELLFRGSHVTLLTSSSTKLCHPKLKVVKWNFYLADLESAFQTISTVYPAPTSLIHLAHSWRNETDTNGININISGTLRLYKWARNNRVKFIFVSSVSSRDGALNQYGRVKYYLESAVEFPYAVVVKVGLVYGGRRQSQWGQLCRIVSVTRVLPMVNPTTRVQPIRLSSVIDGLIRVATTKRNNKNNYIFADDNDLSFGEFLKIVSQMYFNRRLLIIPIPGKLVLTPLKLLASYFSSAGILHDRVLGIVGMKKSDTSCDLCALNIESDDLKCEYERYVTRKKLLDEAIFFIRAASGLRPSGSTAVKYVEAIRLYHNGEAYPLPHWVFHPALLRLIEPLPRIGSDRIGCNDLVIRLNLALGIVETGEFAPYLYRYEIITRKLSSLFIVLISELLLFPVRWVYWKLRK